MEQKTSATSLCSVILLLSMLGFALIFQETNDINLTHQALTNSRAEAALQKYSGRHSPIYGNLGIWTKRIASELFIGNKG